MSYSSAFSQAIFTVVFVADKIQQGMYDFVPTRVISESLNLKSTTLVKILRDLTRSGLIETREGSKGGVRLAVAPDRITLLDLFQAIEADTPLFKIHSELKAQGERPELAKKELHKVLTDAEDSMKAKLKSVKISHFISRLNR